MHRDMAAQCFQLPEDQITKKLRYIAKNRFVFPQFYGDWFLSCAQRMWNAISDKNQGKTVSGVSVIEHLRKRGITRLGDEECAPGTFTSYIRDVEKDFWGRRFRVYNRWRKAWVSDYEENGELQLLSGFTCRGLGGKNEIINYPIQGSAFHCLLWSLIQLVLKELNQRSMKTLIVGQIHDSLCADVPIDEVDDFKALATEVMVERLRAAWEWVIVPLVVEFTVYPHSWAETSKE